MASTTARWRLHRPGLADNADVPADFERLTNQLDDHAKVFIGLLAGRPAFGRAGTYYWATDDTSSGPNGTEYLDIGTAWVQTGGIPDGAVTRSKIAIAAVEGRHISDRSIGQRHLEFRAVGPSQLEDGSVGNQQISPVLQPSQLAVASTEALRRLGTTAGTAAAGNDSRLIVQSASVASIRRIGTAANEAASGPLLETALTESRVACTFGNSWSTAFSVNAVGAISANTRDLFVHQPGALEGTFQIDNLVGGIAGRTLLMRAHFQIHTGISIGSGQLKCGVANASGWNADGSITGIGSSFGADAPVGAIGSNNLGFAMTAEFDPTFWNGPAVLYVQNIHSIPLNYLSTHRLSITAIVTYRYV